MSLILDALRKLEREKGRPDPGVVVVGAVPWHGRERARWPWIVGSLGAAALIASAGFWLARRSPSAPAPAPPSTAAPAAALPPAAAPTAAQSATTSAGEPSAARLTPAPAVVAPPPRATAAAAGALGPVPAPRREPVRNEAANAAPAAAPGTSASGAGEPVAASAPPARPADHLQLMAISVRDGQPVAIISDRLVREGDSFDGVKVLRIGATEVEVEERGQKRVLRF